MIEALGAKVLLAPTDVTAAGVDGGYIDTLGLVTQHECMVSLVSGPGTTPGTCGGYLLTADDTSGTNATTAATFSTQTSAGGSGYKHYSTIQRYVKFVGTVQTGKDMLMSVMLTAPARYA
jgi:hypothetical protein